MSPRKIAIRVKSNTNADVAWLQGGTCQESRLWSQTARSQALIGEDEGVAGEAGGSGLLGGEGCSDATPPHQRGGGGLGEGFPRLAAARGGEALGSRRHVSPAEAL